MFLKWLIWGFDIDWMDVWLLATKFATCAGVQKFVTGGGWVNGFQARYPDLARLRADRALERNGIHGALNPNLMGSFFELFLKSLTSAHVEKLTSRSRRMGS